MQCLARSSVADRRAPAAHGIHDHVLKWACAGTFQHFNTSSERHLGRQQQLNAASGRIHCMQAAVPGQHAQPQARPGEQPGDALPAPGALSDLQPLLAPPAGVTAPMSRGLHARHASPLFLHPCQYLVKM